MRNTMIKKLLLNQGKYETVEGVPPLTLEKSLGRNLKDYKLYGNSIQDGTPTPDTPIEVQSVGEYDETTGKYKVPVVVSGKNLLNPKATLTTLLGVYKGIDIMEYMAQNTILSIKLKEGKSVPSGVYFGAVYKLSTSNAMGYWLIDNGVLKTTTFNLKQLGNTVTNMGIGVYPSTQANWDNIFECFDVQLELGAKATDFELYQKPTVIDIYLDKPLSKIDNYADYIDFENSKVVRKIANVDITKVDGMSAVTSGTYCVFLSNVTLKPYVTGNAGQYTGYAISNKFVRNKGNYNNLYSNGGYIQSYITNSGSPRVAYTLNDTNIRTIIDAQEAIGDGFNVLYILANPTEEFIELPQLPTLKGTTVYTVDTTIQPNNMSATYKRR